MTTTPKVKRQEVKDVLRGQSIEQMPSSQYTVNIGAIQGGVIDLAPPGKRAEDRIRSLPRPPRTLPRQVPGFLDREQEQAQIGQVLARRRTVDLHGPDGTGKTALISQAMHGQLPTAFPDGTVYVRAKGDTYDDLLQDLLKQFYDVGQDPIHFTENDVRRHLAEKRALVAVDDANDLDEDDTAALLDVVPKSALLVAGHQRKLWQSTGVPLGGLPRQQAVALFERACGQAAPQDRPTVESICQALGDVPKAILKAAAIAAQRKVPLDQVLQEVQPQPQRRDPVGQTAWMLGLHLSEGERRTLAGLAAPGGPTVSREALAHITQLAAAKLEKYLARLQKMGLVWSTDGRYGLDEAVLPHIRQFGVDEAMRARAALYYLQHAGQLRPRSKDPDEDNVLASLDYFFRRGQGREVIQIARAVDRYLATAGRWGQWRRVLQRALHAAQQIGDRATEAWAKNQLGVVALGAGNAAAAEGLFRGALSVWRALGDRQGMTIARWNLQVLLGPPPPPPRKAKPEGKPGGGSALPAILGSVATVLVITLVFLIGVAVWPDRPTPPPPPPPTTVAPPPTTVVAPDVEIQLAAGCGQTFAPGDELGILLTASVEGVVDVSWTDPDGTRESLFDAEVQAGQMVRREWDAPEREGDWRLVGDLNDGQATDDCAFSVEVVVEPQVRVWLYEGCDRSYLIGEGLTVQTESSADGEVEVYGVNPDGGRGLLFVEDTRADQVVSRQWIVPQWDGNWALEADFNDGQASDRCQLTVEAPQVQIRIDDDCGQEYEPGAEANVSLWANADGRVDVYLLSQEGEREFLLDQEVQANQTAFQSWVVPESRGDWTLEADLNDGQAGDDCPFSVAAESTPPVIESVWAPPDETEVTCPGDQAEVYAQILDDSELSQVELISRPPEGFWFSTEMERIDDQTYRQALTVYEEPGTDFYVYAEDVYGNWATSDQYAYAVAPCYTILYDFVEMAPKAQWAGYTPEYPYSYALEFPGDPDDSQGFALWVYEATLEDGSRPDSRILETYPALASNGSIEGRYNLRSPVNIVIQEDDRFYARVGFLSGAGPGDVTFKLKWWNGDPDGYSVTLGSLDDSYDGVVQEWMIPLKGLTGRSGYFTLVVEAGYTSAKDEAVWVEARIERP
jgi:hypothetical protein